MNGPQPVSSPLVGISTVSLALYGLFSANPWESVWTCALLYILLRWFWWQQHPGILLYVFLLPFIEIHTTLIEANQRGLKLNELFHNTGQTTFWISSIGLLAVAAGTKTYWKLSNRPYFIDPQKIKLTIQQTSHKRLTLLIVAAILFNQLIQRLIPIESSLRQIEVYSTGLIDILLIALAVKFTIDRKHLFSVIIIFSFLIISSFYSFFSSWKEPLFILLISSLSRLQYFNLKSALRLAPIIIPSIILVLLWQNIKSEYRAYLNGQKFSQRIQVSQVDALLKFQELATSSFDREHLLEESSLQGTYRRIGYLEYFSSAVANVPSRIPHESGNLLLSNFNFALVPRILNPNKGVKDDKSKVEKYTDFYFGTYGGSSFSLGHYCEAYIDWGKFGMMVQLFLFGIFGGMLCSFSLLRAKELNPLLALGILWVCLKPLGTFQSDMITLIGTAFWGGICHLFIFFPLYKLANGYIKYETK